MELDMKRYLITIMYMYLSEYEKQKRAAGEGIQ